VSAILSKFALACQRMLPTPAQTQLRSKPTAGRCWPVMKGQRQKSFHERRDAPSEGQNAIRYTVDNAERSKGESNKQQLGYLLLKAQQEKKPVSSDFK